MTIRSINPHDQSVVGETTVSSKEDAVAAVKSAKDAFPNWKKTPIDKRASYIKKYGELLHNHKDELARLITLEMGKPLNQSKGEVTAEVDYVNFYATEGVQALQDEIVYQKDTSEFKVTYEPYGVCLCIPPWNYPVTLLNSGVVPALIAGNTVVFKPDEHTTLSQKRAIELLWEAGIPKNVLHLIIGGGETGKLLVDQPVDLIWFTGSTPVGLEIYKKCGEKFIKGLMEMGGSSAGVIFADADLESAVENTYLSRFSNTGQICNAVKRLFVQKPAYKKVLELLKGRLQKASLGNPLDSPDLGPLVYREQVINLEAQVEDAIKKGAKVEIGGKKPSNPSLSKGNYFEATLLTNINPEMKVMAEEVFGPALPIVSFDTEEEVVKMANNTQWGLGNEVYTKDLAKAERVARHLESGVVGINTFDYFKPAAPFGGYKKSGIGREYGKIGMQEFAQVKLIAINKPA